MRMLPAPGGALGQTATEDSSNDGARCCLGIACNLKNVRGLAARPWALGQHTGDIAAAMEKDTWHGPCDTPLSERSSHTQDRSAVAATGLNGTSGRGCPPGPLSLRALKQLVYNLTVLQLGVRPWSPWATIKTPAGPVPLRML